MKKFVVLLIAVLMFATACVNQAPGNVTPVTSAVPSVMPSVAPSIVPTGEIVPLVLGSYLLGGVKDGAWVQAEKIWNVLPTSGPYDFYEGQMKIGQVDGGKAFYDEPTGSYYLEIKFSKTYEFATTAKWELFPRKLVDSSIADAEKIVAQYLKDKGMENPKITVQKAVQADLDNDGILETVIQSYNFKDYTPYEVKGHYSLVLVVKNGVVVKSLDEYIGKKTSTFEKGPLETRAELITAADFNGDGKLELLTSSGYYEGEFYYVYDTTTWKYVLSGGAGV